MQSGKLCSDNEVYLQQLPRRGRRATAQAWNEMNAGSFKLADELTTSILEAKLTDGLFSAHLKPALLSTYHNPLVCLYP